MRKMLKKMIRFRRVRKLKKANMVKKETRTGQMMKTRMMKKIRPFSIFRANRKTIP
jgi:hypothetical protein